MFTRVEPEVGSGEWKDNYIYEDFEDFFDRFPEEALDKESVIVAVNVHGPGVLYFAEVFRNDVEVMSVAFEKDSQTLALASPRLLDDFDFAVYAVTKDASTLPFFSDRLQEDRKFILAMYEIHPPGKVSAFDKLPWDSLEDYFSEGLKEKIGGLGVVEYLRREEFHERLQTVVPSKVSSVPVRKRKI